MAAARTTGRLVHSSAPGLCLLPVRKPSPQRKCTPPCGSRQTMHGAIGMRPSAWGDRGFMGMPPSAGQTRAAAAPAAAAAATHAASTKVAGLHATAAAAAPSGGDEFSRFSEAVRVGGANVVPVVRRIFSDQVRHEREPTLPVSFFFYSEPPRILQAWKCEWDMAGFLHTLSHPYSFAPPRSHCSLPHLSRQCPNPSTP